MPKCEAALPSGAAPAVGRLPARGAEAPGWPPESLWPWVQFASPPLRASALGGDVLGAGTQAAAGRLVAGNDLDRNGLAG